MLAGYIGGAIAVIVWAYPFLAGKPPYWAKG